MGKKTLSLELGGEISCRGAVRFVGRRAVKRMGKKVAEEGEEGFHGEKREDGLHGLS